MAARSTTAGTPVKSWRMTRAGLNGSSPRLLAIGSHAFLRPRVLLAYLKIIQVAQAAFEQNLDGKRQLVHVGDAGFLQTVQAENPHVSGLGGKLADCAERIVKYGHGANSMRATLRPQAQRLPATFSDGGNGRRGVAGSQSQLRSIIAFSRGGRRQASGCLGPGVGRLCVGGSIGLLLARRVVWAATSIATCSTAVTSTYSSALRPGLGVVGGDVFAVDGDLGLVVDLDGVLLASALWRRP